MDAIQCHQFRTSRILPRAVSTRLDDRMPEEKYWYLKNCDLFERLDASELAQIESRCRIRKFDSKCLIYLPNDLADGVLLLAAGRVKICGLTPDGKQTILAFIEPGELFGELAILGQREREEYAEVVESATVVLIPAAEMQRLLGRHPEISLGVMKLIGFRRQKIERRLQYLLFHSTRDRLIHLLLELLEQYGVSTSRGTELRIKLSHQDLANIIGSTRECVTGLLGELQSEGLLTTGRQRIIFRDVKRLSGSIDGRSPRARNSADWRDDVASGMLPLRPTKNEA